MPISADDIADETRKDRTLACIYHDIMNGWSKERDSDIAPYYRPTRRDELSAEEGCILWGLRVVIPPALQQQMMHELHHGHVRIVRVKAIARGYFWFPGINNEIEKEVAQCEACQTFRANSALAPLIPWKFPAATWEKVHIDFFSLNGQEFLIIIDSHSKWIDVKLMSSTTSEKAIEVLRGIFASYGLPKELVSDNGPQLALSEFHAFLKKNGVKHTLVPAYHPASNGAAERNVQIVKSTLKKHLETEKSGHEVKRSLRQRLNGFLLTYRITPKSTTGRAPGELFLKRELHTRFSLLRPDLTTKVRDKQKCQANVYDPVKIQNREFKENDIVSIRNYFGARKGE